MAREFSAGGVVVRHRGGIWWMAAIEPQTEAKPPKSSKTAKPSRPVLALPKGIIDPGERPLEAAVREVREETGVIATPVTKLADSKYVYIRSWGDGERVFKVVSFYLLRYTSGRINDIAEKMRIEVARARWVRLNDAPSLLSYKGEKEIARRALQYLATHTL
jgi:8-oxo-dGTP pyrophosphatase MutT (NUDIX family)